MLRHDGDAPIELTAELVDVLRVLGDFLLAPAERDGLRKRDERRGGGDDHALRRGVLEERGITLEGCGIEVIPRHEHHDEIRRHRESIPVGLGGELLHVRAQLHGVKGETALALRLVQGIDGIEIRGHRGLGVHDQVTVAREADDGVGA